MSSRPRSRCAARRAVVAPGTTQKGSGSWHNCRNPLLLDRARGKLVVGLLIRVTISATVLFAAYYLVPTKSSGEHSDLPWLILELAIFGVVVAIQVPTIVKAKYPKLPAIEALAVTVPLFLLIFYRISFSHARTDPAAFASPRDNSTAAVFHRDDLRHRRLRRHRRANERDEAAGDP